MITKNTLSKLGVLLALSIPNHLSSTLLAQGTAFTYQGRLTDAGSLPSGSYDLRLGVYDATGAGNQYGSTLTNRPVAVTNGLFTVIVDFGPGVFAGANLWLEIGVRTNGSTGAYTVLSPRQALTPTPYAVYAGTATLASNASAATSLALPYSGTASSSSSLFTLDNSGTGPAATFLGNVGIGTTTPNATLNVNGGVRIDGTGSNLRLAGGDGGAGGTEISFASDADGLGGGGGLALRAFGAGTTRALSVAQSDNENNRLLSVSYNGNVGIGTTSPGYTLDVAGQINASGAFSASSAYTGTYGTIITVPYYGRQRLLSSDWSSATGDYVDLEVPGNDGAGNVLRITSHGNVGIGTTAPSKELEVHSLSGDAQIGVQSGDAGGVLWTMQSSQVNNIALNGAFQIIDRSANVTGLTIYPSDHRVAVRVLEIDGGSDVAEPFHISTEEAPKGSVVIIDEENAGQLKLSDRAYDNRVAGIVSGANGIHPGLTLSQQGALDSGQNVALSGRVYVLADATSSPIKPGDLLTSSDTPGHCMKVTDRLRAQGAVIGKAMSSLKEGRGMVLVLVTLE